MQKVKVALVLPLGESESKKVWRFDKDDVQSYTLQGVETEMIELFGPVTNRRPEDSIGFSLSYNDSFIGRVDIHSTADLHAALLSFMEEDDIAYRTLHLKEVHKYLKRPADCEIRKTKKRRKTTCTQQPSTSAVAATPESPSTSVVATTPESPSTSVVAATPESPSTSAVAATPVVVTLNSPASLTSVEVTTLTPSHGDSCDQTQLNLVKVLEAVVKEENVEEQPLYIHDKVIKCHWCSSFKGSVLLKHINQHVKKSKSHMRARNKVHGNSDSVVDHNESVEVHEKDVSLQQERCRCLGVYDRRFVPLYDDRHAGTTTPVKIWKALRTHGRCDSSFLSVSCQCDCCSTYTNWKKSHPQQHRALIESTNTPTIYEVHPNEQVTVIVRDTEVEYKGTIRALAGAPKGACIKTAFTTGQHPYTCDACEAIVRGKSSSLLHKLNRSLNLKHPRSEALRATRPGVNRLYVSAKALENALVASNTKNKVSEQKISSLEKTNQLLLHESWHKHESARPFVETLLSLIEENKLSEFDMSFLENWLEKKNKGRFHKADAQARSLAVLYSNRLGEKTYSELAPLLGLPKTRQARAIRSELSGKKHYLPGINDWAIEMAALRTKRPIQNGMDGTRVIRSVELYLDRYLVGQEFPPDVRLFPCETDLPTADNMDNIKDHVLHVREQGLYAAEAYSFNLSDTTGVLPDMLIGSIPEAKKGITGSHVLALMFEVEKRALHFDLSLCGHCTDSAGNSLRALHLFADPSSYSALALQPRFIGLDRAQFIFYAPFLRPDYPSIAYPCWDHSSRTSLRNLMNKKVQIVSGVLANKGDGVQHYHIATAHDLQLLKRRKPGSTIRHADITPHVKQNCDATQRVLSATTIKELSAVVPESCSTQLYLKASVWIHAPFRNRRFGPPTVVVRSLWAGLMTWRRWRRFIQLHRDLTLTNNFISPSHYITIELLAHAGILHQLSLFLCFPDLSLDEYSLRHTGNRGIEAVHGVFRGGTSSLPITSPNLSFQDMLTRMNKINQIREAEHSLKQIDGHSISATKKKRLTSATDSTDPPYQGPPYSKPADYRTFLSDLDQACNSGDIDSKTAIESLAPQIAEVLKKEKEWENPKIGIEHSKLDAALLLPVLAPTRSFTVSDFDELISAHLGDREQPTGPNLQTTGDVNQASANLITDLEEGQPVSVRRTLKLMQPHREQPSKDRRKRFAYGEIPGDTVGNGDNDLSLYQYWAIRPSKPSVRKAKCFLLGQVIYITQEERVVQSAMKGNKNVEVMLSLFSYAADKREYSTAGRSSLCKADKVLLAEVSSYVEQSGEAMKFDSQLVPALVDHIPYHEEVDVDSRLQEFAIHLDENEEAEEEEEEDDEDSDPYIVEKVLKKRYHTQRQQYEFLVKWQGYSETDNSWELATNVPSHKITEFEKNESTNFVSRSGRSSRTTHRDDFIKTF